MPAANEEIDPALAEALAQEEEEEQLPAALLDDGEDGDPPFDPIEQRLDKAMAIETPADKPKNKGGRPPKNKPADPPPEPAPGIAVRGRPRLDMDIQSVWNRLVRVMGAKGFGGPENVSIAVRRLALGPDRSEPEDLQPIQGAAVGGSDTKSPGEDLYDYLVRVYHVGPNKGPARYRLKFHIRGVQKNYMGSAEVILPAAAEIRKQWEAMNEQEGNRRIDNMRMPRMSNFGAAPGMSAMPGMPVAPPTIPAPAPGTDSTMMMLQWVMGMYQDAIARGQQPPAIPPEFMALLKQPVGAAPAAAAPAEDLETRVARTVVQTLQAMGFKPPTVGEVPAAPLTPTIVQEKVSDPMSAAKSFFQQMRDFRRMEEEMREMFTPETEEPETPAAPATSTVIVKSPDEEEEEGKLKPVNEAFARFDGDPILFGKQRKDETTFQWLVRLGSGNPKLVGAALAKGAEKLDQSAFGKLVTAFTQMGGAHAQQAQAHAVGQGNVVEAPQNGAPSGWRPNMG